MACEMCDNFNEDYFVYATEHWNVFLRYNQHYLGCCVVELKRHCENLPELNQEEWRDFILLVGKMEAALKKAFGARMFNWACLMNMAYKRMPPNPHVHWWFIPRYDKKVRLGGQLFEDTEFAHHYDKDKNMDVPRETINEIILKIRKALEK